MDTDPPFDFTNIVKEDEAKAKQVREYVKQLIQNY